MPVLFDLLTLCEAEGRTVMHLKSEDVPKDVAELEYLLTNFDVIAGERSVYLLEKAVELPRIPETTTE